MKLELQNIPLVDHSGSVTIMLEEDDDIWHAYKLIKKGDHVMSMTMRKVQRDERGRIRDAERLRLKLELEVEDVDFGSILRIRGKTISQNEHVKLGVYHTLELSKQTQFTLTKVFWDSATLDDLKEATNATANADIAAVMMQEGLATICLSGSNIAAVNARIQRIIPHKKVDNAMKNFFEDVLQAILRHVDFNIVQCLVIASPDSTKDKFYEYVSLRKDIRHIKSKIFLAYAASGSEHSLKEVLSNIHVMRAKNAKVDQGVKALEKFFTMISNDSSRVAYGPKHVEVAHGHLAVQTLLITDGLLRNVDIATRQKYVELVDSVKEGGGTVHIFSSVHETGKRLTQTTGIAAILRFPLPDLEDMVV